jgi:hypothetical protein
MRNRGNINHRRSTAEFGGLVVAFAGLSQRRTFTANDDVARFALGATPFNLLRRAIWHPSQCSHMLSAMAVRLWHSFCR